MKNKNTSSAAAHSSITKPSQTSTSHINQFPQQPYYFIVDTDSTPYAIDTGANMIIANDAKYLTELNPSSDKIKGIESRGVRIAGTGKLSFLLKSNQGRADIVRNLDGIYVPSSPYNLIPPQVLTKQMRKQGFKIKYFHHDDEEYLFSYFTSSSNSKQVKNNLTVHICKNSLFILRTN